MARLQIHTGLPDVSLVVIIPEFMKSRKAQETGMTEKEYYSDRSLPVLWLLHGARGDAADWPRYSMVEVYAEEKGLIVVCPTGNNGWWVNQAAGTAWEDIVTEKLWELVHGMFPTSDKPEDNYIAGLSMGGYGAMRIGLRHPEKYSRIAAFSAGFGIPRRYASGAVKGLSMEEAFGAPETVLGSQYDEFKAAEERAASREPLPPIYLSCGTKDTLYDINTEYREHLKKLGYEVTWDEAPFGHEWRFWDQQVEKFINTLP